MRTKLFVLLSAILTLAGTTAAFAQNYEGKQSDNVTLNIKLHQIQTLVVLNGKTVDLEYTTKEHYKEGVASEIKDHLQVFSTGAFKITAKALGDGTLKGISDSDMTIPVNNVKLTASNGNVTFTQQTLNSEKGVEIVSSDTGGRDLNFNVKYETKHGDDAYIDHYRKSENPTVYTTEVTYTITPA